MEITIIGAITIIISIYAFLKNEYLLLDIVIFLSTFVAASAINIYPTTTAIVPFEIPLVLWVIKQCLNMFKNRKNIEKEKIKNIFKENKIFIALFIFFIVIIISEVFLLISRINYPYYDVTFKENRVIRFGIASMTQSIRVLAFIVFTMLLSLKVKNKDEIKHLLKIFSISTFFAVVWGLIQYILFYLDINYPAFLFNNNPWYAQGYDQVMHGIKRINSIGTEPSVFSLNLLAVIPIFVIDYLYSKKEKNIWSIIPLILIYICTMLTTSSTAYVGVVVETFIIFIIFLAKYLKAKSITNKRRVINLIGSIFISIVITAGLAIFGNRMYNKRIENANNEIRNKKSQEQVIKEKKNETETISKEENNETEIVSEEENNETEIVSEEENNETEIVSEEKNNETEIISKEEKNKTEIHEEKNDIENVQEMPKVSIESLIKETTISKLASGSGKERMDREKLGIEIFKISPIFGVGFGSFRTFSILTNLLVNTGIVGLMSFLYIIYVVFKKIILNREKDEKYFLIFLISTIGMLVALFISVPDLIYIYFWSILVLAYNYFSEGKITEKKRARRDKITIGIDARGLGNKKTGIATYIEEVMKEFSKNKNKNIKYILYSNRKININIETNKSIIIKEYNKPAGTLWLYFCLPKILNKDKVDVFWGTQHLLPQRNNYTSDIKYVLTVHDLANHKFKHIGEWKNAIIQKVFVKKSCEVADEIIAVSKSTKNDIVEILEIDSNKINVVYEGTNCSREYILNIEQENEILNKFNVIDKKYIFFVSTIEPRKNIITLVKAFEEMKKDGNYKDFKLILAGGLGWKYENIITTIKNSECKEDINLAGYISKEEKECLMHNAKCFVYPSLYEGFGLPVLEAMQKGAIVVTSNISSIPEIGGDVPFYLDNLYDENELAKLIKDAILLGEEKKKEIIERGYKQVDKFTWEKCAKYIQDFLV